MWPAEAGHRWRGILQRRQRRSHDAMLVLNMSIFNFDDGWNRIFNPRKFTKTLLDKDHKGGRTAQKSSKTST